MPGPPLLTAQAPGGDQVVAINPNKTHIMDVRLQSFKYVGAGLATISLAEQEQELGIVFGAYLSAYSKKPYYGKSSD